MNRGLHGGRDLHRIACRAHHKLGEIHGRLQVVDEDRRFGRRLQLCLPRVGDHTNDLGRICDCPAEIQLLPDRVLAGKESFHKLAIDHDDARGAKLIVSIKVPAAEQWGPHGLEIASTDDEELSAGRSGGCGRWFIGTRETGA